MGRGWTKKEQSITGPQQCFSQWASDCTKSSGTSCWCEARTDSYMFIGSWNVFSTTRYRVPWRCLCRPEIYSSKQATNRRAQGRLKIPRGGRHSPKMHSFCQLKHTRKREIGLEIIVWHSYPSIARAALSHRWVGMGYVLKYPIRCINEFHGLGLEVYGPQDPRPSTQLLS